MRVGFPARIPVAEGYGCSTHFKYSAHHIGNVLFGGGGRAALAGLDADDTTGLHLYGGQIGGGFHQPRNVLAHGIHTVGCGIDGLQQSLGGIFVNGFGTGCFRFEHELEVRVNDGILCLHFGGKDIQVCTQGMLVGIGYGNYRVCFAGNGVAQVTTVYFAKVHVVLLGCLAQEAVQQLVGIAAPQVYVAAGVSAFQPLYLHFAAEIPCRYVHFPVGEFGNGIYTSCTADEELAFILGIEVQQNVSVHEAFFQGEGTGQSGLLIHGEEAFDRTVLDAVVGKDSQFGGYTDAIVGSQGRTFGFQPFTVNFGFDRVGQEVVLHVVVLFTYHVDVRLKYDSLAVFHTRSGGFLYQHVSGFVHLRFQLMFFSECF